MKRLVVFLSLLALVSFSAFACAEEPVTIPACVIWRKPVLREEPRQDAAMVAPLSHGDILEVGTDVPEDPYADTDGYVYAYTADGQEGWVLEESLCYWPDWLVIAGDNVPVYAGESMRYKATDGLAKGTKVILLEELETFYCISFEGGRIGYISKMEDVYSYNANSYYYYRYNTKKRHIVKRSWVYALPTEESARVGYFEADDVVEVYSAKLSDEKWVPVEYNGRYAYLQLEALR